MRYGRNLSSRRGSKGGLSGTVNLVIERLSGREGLGHFEETHFHWASWMDAADRARYETAHRTAHRYCRSLNRRFRRRRDTPGLLAELRRFYRATPEAKLRAA